MFKNEENAGVKAGELGVIHTTNIVGVYIHKHACGMVVSARTPHMAMSAMYVLTGWPKSLHALCCSIYMAGPHYRRLLSCLDLRYDEGQLIL